jgi:hypothetical protein
MSRLEVPIIGKTLRATGDTLLRFPCYFLGDPNNPPPLAPIHLLGLTGVINQIRLYFDGTPATGMPYGRLIVEKV